MPSNYMRLVLAATIFLQCAFCAPPAAPTLTHLSDAFSPGWMLKDTNEDGIADVIEGKIVVPATSTAAENAAAANIAARLGFGSTGLTLPLVITKEADASAGPRIWIGKDAVPAELLSGLNEYLGRLEANEGVVAALNGGLVLMGHDDAGLTAAADAFSARAPYIWKIPGEQFAAIANEVSRLSSNATIRLVGVTYLIGKAGINRAFLEADNGVTVATLHAALSSPHLGAVDELIVRQGGSDLQATNAKPLPAPAAPSPSATAPDSIASPDASTVSRDALYIEGTLQRIGEDAHPFFARWSALRSRWCPGSCHGQSRSPHGSRDHRAIAPPG